MKTKWIKLVLAVACGGLAWRIEEGPQNIFAGDDAVVVLPVLVAVIVWCLAVLLLPRRHSEDGRVSS